MQSGLFTIIALAIMGDLLVTIWLAGKIMKLEKFQTGEAQANLELINQSLNRLSQITELLERQNQPVRIIDTSADTTDDEVSNMTKERKAISLLRRGENPRLISRKLGISRSEMDLLVASEKLGNSRQSALTPVQ